MTVNRKTAAEGEMKTENSGRNTLKKTARILVAPSNNRWLKEVDLQNHSVKKYYHGINTRIVALEYVSKVGKVIFGTELLGSIYEYTLAEQKLHKLVNATLFDIDVDQDRQKVFISVLEPKKYEGIITFTPSERVYRPIIRNQRRCAFLGLTLDTKQKVIFTSCKTFIVKLTYTGKELERFNAPQSFALVLDKVNQLLYYHQDVYLYVRIMEKKVNKSLVKLNIYPWTLTLHENNLYMSSVENYSLYAIDLEDMKIRELSRVHFRPGCQFCFI